MDNEPATIAIPDDLVKKWWDHNQLGTEFKAIVETFNEKHPKVEDLQKQTTPNKRTGTATSMATPPTKKPKVDGEQVKAVLVSSDQEGRLPKGTLLHEINLVNLKDCKIFFHVDGVYVKNCGSEQALGLVCWGCWI